MGRNLSKTESKSNNLEAVKAELMRLIPLEPDYSPGVTARVREVGEKAMFRLGLGWAERELAKGFFSLFEEKADDLTIAQVLIVFRDVFMPYILNGSSGSNGTTDDRGGWPYRPCG